MTVQLDHLVVAAATLAEGVAWCEAMLGALPGGGGRHAAMGTHNRLLHLGGGKSPFDAVYLEVIAIDPDAPPPARPRWFGLDAPALQRRLARHGPQLRHAVARSTMLDMHRWGLIAVGIDPGTPFSMQRETPAGPLAWQILLRDDGTLPCAGALPSLIAWGPGGTHPSRSLPASGVALRSLALHGVPDAAARVLRLRHVQVDAVADAPPLRAVLDTPRGAVTLEALRDTPVEEAAE